MILENIRLAFTSLWANKMRALLTMLGIIIGIGSVIAIVTVGNSLTSSVTDSLASLGGNSLQVGVEPRPLETGEQPMSYSYSTEDLLTPEMIDAIQERFSQQIKASIVRAQESVQNVTVDGTSASMQMVGVNSGYFAADKVTMLHGRPLRKSDNEGCRYTAVISDRAAEKLFGSVGNALGKSIAYTTYTSTDDYTIVGVYEYQDMGVMFGSGIGGGDPTTDLYVPYNTITNGDSVLFYAEIVPEPGVDGDELAARINKFMNEGYYKNNEQFCVETYNLQSQMASITSVLGTISMAIGIIAGISLLVGGIGVMNIMLVSITERTREIGVRKALGASNSAIRTQFIIESMIICAIGGVFGIAVGLGLGNVGANLLGAPAKVNVSTLLGAVGFSMAIGLFFGYYPAGKAAKLDPIEALRYE